MAGIATETQQAPFFVTQDQIGPIMDKWYAKKQPLTQDQAKPNANIYAPSYDQQSQKAPQVSQAQQSFYPMNSWSPMGMGYGIGSGMGYGSGFGSGYGRGFGGYSMQSPFSGYGMQQSPFGGIGGYGGYGQQMYSPYGGIGSGFGMGGMGYGNYGIQTPFSYGQQMGGYGMQSPFGGYGGFGRGRGFDYGRQAPAPTNVTTPDSPGTTA